MINNIVWKKTLEPRQHGSVSESCVSDGPDSSKFHKNLCGGFLQARHQAVSPDGSNCTIAGKTPTNLHTLEDKATPAAPLPVLRCSNTPFDGAVRYQRPYGATAARLTPDQKVIRSNRVGVIF